MTSRSRPISIHVGDGFVGKPEEMGQTIADRIEACWKKREAEMASTGCDAGGWTTIGGTTSDGYDNSATTPASKRREFTMKWEVNVNDELRISCDYEEEAVEFYDRSRDCILEVPFDQWAEFKGMIDEMVSNGQVEKCVRYEVNASQIVVRKTNLNTLYWSCEDDGHIANMTLETWAAMAKAVDDILE